MTNSNAASVLQSQLENLAPDSLRDNNGGSNRKLTVDILNEIETLLDTIRKTVPEDEYDVFDKALESIHNLLYSGPIMELAEFNFLKYEQELWEQNNPSDEEKVAAMSAAANQGAFEKLSELIDNATDDLKSTRAAIVQFIADANEP